TVLPDAGQRLADHLADLLVARGHGGDLRDGGLALDGGGGREQCLAHLVRPLGDAGAERDRIGACGNVLQAGLDQRLSENGRGGGAVAGDVVGLGRDTLEGLGAGVLERFLQLYLTGDAHTVVRDGGTTEGLGEHDVPATRAERHLDGVGQLVDTALESPPRGLVELDLLGHVLRLLLDSDVPQRIPPRVRNGTPGRNASGLLGDDSQDVARRQDQVLLTGVLDLGSAVLAVDDDVAFLDVQRDALVAIFVPAAGADGDDGALLGLLLRRVRDDQAGGSRRLGLVGLDEDLVLERLDVHARHDEPSTFRGNGVREPVFSNTGVFSHHGDSARVPSSRVPGRRSVSLALYTRECQRSRATGANTPTCVEPDVMLRLNNGN